MTLTSPFQSAFWMLILVLSPVFACSQDLRDERGASILRPQAEERAVPPSPVGMPISFTLDKPSKVTLVIDDEQGHRVRNLISGVFYDKGTHTVSWDGYRAGGPAVGGAPALSPAKPGRYRVHGLIHEGIGMRYLLSIQSPGPPPWHTLDGRGAWLADHTPPMDILYLPQGSPYGKEPQMLICASVAETGHALMWVNLEGRKLYGKSIGWEGGVALASDQGARAVTGDYAYALNIIKDKQLTLFAHQRDGNHRVVFRSTLSAPHNRTAGVFLDVYDGVAVVSLPLQNELWFIDVATGHLIKRQTLAAPRGVAVDQVGMLFVVENQGVSRYEVDWQEGGLTFIGHVVKEGLEDPVGLAWDEKGRLYVSDRGESHQVKVFDATGRLLQTVGKPGGVTAGPYDPSHMQNPNGMAIDPQGRLWVAEVNYIPKRFSIWVEGRFLKAYYGPPKYGGGGVFDPKDRTLFYYSTGGGGNDLQEEGARGGMTFRVDWQRGTDVLESIYRLSRQDDPLFMPTQSPQEPVYIGNHRYLVNVFNQAAQGMNSLVGIWQWQPDETVALVAVIGYQGRNDSKAWLPLDRFRELSSRKQRPFFFVWSDLNEDRHVSLEEVQTRPLDEARGLLYVHKDLSVLTTWLDAIPAPAIKASGIPVFDLGKMKRVASVDDPQADVLGEAAGWIIHTGDPIQGFNRGKPVWTYPNPWNQRSRSPAPGEPGMLVETNRIIGYPVTPRDGEAGEVWGLNSDKGSIYLLTMDGLFLDELGGDVRTTPLLRDTTIVRGDLVADRSFNEENFWPSMTQLEDDGTIVLTAGKEHSSAFQLEGFGSVRRVDLGTVVLAEAPPAVPVENTPVTTGQAEPAEVILYIKRQPPALDGDLSDWEKENWMVVDAARGIRAAVSVTRTHLYLAIASALPDLLNNQASMGWQYLFATGGGIDLMVRTRPGAGTRDTKRPGPLPGDVRLFITRVGDATDGRVQGIRMEQAGRGPEASRLTYTSPVGEVAFARVEAVGAEIEVAQQGGRYEVGIPLKLLGLNPRQGQSLLGDIGVLLGNGAETQTRLYWSNKNTAIVSDLPSEVRLMPEQWGRWTFERER